MNDEKPADDAQSNEGEDEPIRLTPGTPEETGWQSIAPDKMPEPVPGGTYGMRPRAPQGASDRLPPLPIAPPSASVDVRALLDTLHHERIRVGFGVGSGIKLGIGIILSPVILFAASAAIIRILVLATDWQTADLMWSRIEGIWRQVGTWFVGTG